MADFYGTWRTSRFKVKNEKEFREWVDTLPETELREYGKGFFSLMASEGSQFGTIPQYRHDDPSDDEESDDFDDGFDLTDELAPHLAKGWCAAIFEIGNEKARYLGGIVEVVDWRGKKKAININHDAEKLAKKLGAKYERYDKE